ncbi:MAG: acyl-CoA dehydrogenase family protein [Microthrixaceae bacterium]
MDFGLPGDGDERRQRVRAFLREHPSPSAAQLGEAGYMVPHWPEPWGLGADPIHQLIIDEEFRSAGVRRPYNPIGLGWAGPTLIEAGTPEQQQRWLPGIVSGADTWCQLFSEPGAGSDLASLSTAAVRDGDEWVVTGQKVWTSLAHDATWGILITRTDLEATKPGGSKHSGITYFVCPMDAPGIEIRPLVEMTGAHTFNEVFMDGVRIPDSYRIGDVGQGWSLAKITLANERVSLSSGGVLWGVGPHTEELYDEVRAAGGTADPVMRQRLAQTWIEGEVLRLIRMRTISAVVAGKSPGPEASVRKILADEHGQAVMELAKDLAGPGGMVTDCGPLGRPAALWHYGYLFARALTIGGGTGEVQRNILGERVLGLPHEPGTS